MLDALVVAPHPDDAELGVGGTIIRLGQQGWSVGILDLTSGEPTPLGTIERRAAETAAANGRAGQSLAQKPGPSQPESGAEPDPSPGTGGSVPPGPASTDLRPYWEDAHPDHIAATKLVEDARFWSKLSKSDIPGQPFHPARILYYFSVHLRIVERPSLVIDISDQVDAKASALRCYRSQLVDNQPEGQPGVIDSVCDRTRYWGQLVGVRHAEPFASREPIGLRGLDHLLL